MFDEDDVELRIVDLGKELAEMKVTLDEIKEYIVRADTTIAKVAEQIMPTLDQLMKSPMLKMLGVKSK